MPQADAATRSIAGGGSMKTVLMWIGALTAALAIATVVVFAVAYFLICGQGAHGVC